MQQVMSLVWLRGWSSKEKYMFATDRSLLSNKKDSLEEACQDNAQELVVNRVPSWNY